jgi:hypothetical protein
MFSAGSKLKPFRCDEGMIQGFAMKALTARFEAKSTQC